MAGAAMLVLALALPAAAADAERAYRWQDERIAESSGLVVVGDALVTANDSGDAARLFVVDRRGRTLRTVAYDAPARDVEALAPAGPGHVWVADVGDNARERSDLTLHRVRLSDGATQTYPVAYADGRARDAESLVALPSGRLAVIEKGLLGGQVFRSAPSLVEGEVNVLAPVGRVREVATDAAYDPGSGRVLVRGYASMGAYDLPDWDEVASVALPEQPQGEALAVDGDGVLLGSEGVGTTVWRVPVPEPAPRPASTSPPAADAPGEASVTGYAIDVRPLGAAAGVGLLAVGTALVLRRRAARRRERG